MNERILELANIWANRRAEDEKLGIIYTFSEKALEKFAELIVKECSNLLFDESERLYAYSTESDNMRESDEAELVAEKCVDLITMIEEHFGVEE